MIVSEKYRFIFVHIPKSGGSSCDKALKRSLPLWERSHWLTHKRSKHQSLCVVQERMRMERPSWRYFWQKPLPNLTDYFTFSFVRNPWDRVVSLYHYLQRTSSTSEIQSLSSFGEFIAAVEQRQPFIEAMHSFRSQQSLLTNLDGSRIVKFVGRFETLADDFQTVCRKLNVPCRLPHVNQTRHAHYSDYYDEWSRQVIADRFAEDIAAFGYQFNEEQGARAA